MSTETWVGLAVAAVMLFAGIIGCLLKLQLSDIKESITTIFGKLDSLRCGEHDVGLAKLTGRVDDHERRITKLEE